MHFTSGISGYMCCLVIMLLSKSTGYAQNQPLYAIESLPLQVSAESTVSLSFAAAVKNVDRGSAELLAQKAKGVENVVLLRAARSDIQPTSLIVITADGQIHTFEVRYQQRPSCIGLQVLPKQHQPGDARFAKAIDQTQIQESVSLAMDQQSNLRRKGAAGDFSVQVDGLYVSGPVICIRLRMANRSVIDYEIETLRIFASDRKQIKRSASQQQELELIGSSSESDQIKASEQRTVVLALVKTTLPKSKNLVIQLTERGGARHISVPLKARHLSKIAAIPTTSHL
jgi:conjugative transposon TraN protein